MPYPSVMEACGAMPNDPVAPLSQPGYFWLIDRVGITVGRHGRFMHLTNDAIGQVLSLYGEWAEPETRLLTGLVRPGDTVIDVGAHIGTLTVPLAKAVGPTGHVLAVEPQIPLYQLLCANLALNGLLNVRTQHVLMGAEPGFVTLPRFDYAQTSNYGAISFSEDAVEATPATDRLALLTLDSLTDHLSACRLVKIDVEGMEAKVIDGAAALIGRTRPLVYAEVNTEVAFNALAERAERHGYRMLWHCFHGFNPENAFGNPRNVYGDYGDANVLMVPREMAIDLPLPEARGFAEVHDLYPGVLER